MKKIMNEKLTSSGMTLSISRSKQVNVSDEILATMFLNIVIKSDTAFGQKKGVVLRMNTANYTRN